MPEIEYLLTAVKLKCTIYILKTGINQEEFSRLFYSHRKMHLLAFYGLSQTEMKDFLALSNTSTCEKRHSTLFGRAQPPHIGYYREYPSPPLGDSQIIACSFYDPPNFFLLDMRENPRGVLWISSDGDNRMGAKIDNPKNSLDQNF